MHTRGDDQAARIFGYAISPSVFPGKELALCLASDHRTVRASIHFSRWSSSGWRHMGSSPSSSIGVRSRGAVDRAWAWPPVLWKVPRSWPTGVYRARAAPLCAPARRCTREHRRHETILFVVKSLAPGKRAPLLYKLPLLTYAAYNAATLGGALGATRPTSLYQLPDGARVTLHRPGVGTDPWNRWPDWEDPTSPRQTFSHWDAKLLSWLETAGYEVDLCTDIDIHRETAALPRYRALLCGAHDEYWTEPERAAVEAHVEAGGNVAFFSGNTAWWRTRLDERGGNLTMARLDHWPEHKRESRLTGVSYRHGDGKWTPTVGLSFSPRREPVGYRVARPSHWVFAGTNVRRNSVFGAAQRLIGYECDGVTAARRRASDGTPPGFVVLASAATPREWDEPTCGHRATMGIYRRNGQVFTASTVDWARVLAAGESTVEKVTRNVLDRFSRDARGGRRP